MKPLRIDSLLQLPADGVTVQTEWTTHGANPVRALLLEIAFFAGTVGPGLYMFSAALRYNAGMLLGLFVVIFGYALPHALYLGRMERSWRAILRPGASWISRGFIFASAFMILAMLSVAHYIPALRSGPLNPDSAGFEYIVIGAVVSAFLLAMYPGFLFSVLKAIPFWHSFVLIPLFLIQAFGGGAAVTIIMYVLQGDKVVDIPGLAVIDSLFVTATAGLVGLQLLVGIKSGPTGRISVMILMQGAYRKLFVLGAIVIGLIAPMVLFAAVGLLGVPVALAVPAALMQLAGILLFKYCILNAGAYRQLFTEDLIAQNDSTPD
ncbi:MAG: polysulfide reductase NrfD [Phycisphaerae bacterium]|jgi:formate-dependent nitrite reductase membrane component NrfD|nr:polysulfide reductase NrfD [Phycisphaerae bacterium]